MTSLSKFPSIGTALYPADFPRIAEIKVLQEGDARIKSIDTFEEAGLHPAMLKNLQLAGYKTPTPIQKYCFPGIAMGRDLIGIAQTGKWFPIVNYRHLYLSLITLFSRLWQDRRVYRSYYQQTHG